MFVSKDKKLFSQLGLIIISFFLFLGIFFAYQEKKGIFDTYFENKYFPASFKPFAFKIYHIGFVTDAHAKFSTSAAGIKMASKIPMQSFVSEMNDIFHPDFVVDGGDFIDGTRRFGEKSMQDFSLFSRIFEEIQAPKYRVLGNHELRGMSRETWIKENNYEKSYYYFDYENLRVIVFDSTLVSGIKNSTFEYEKQYIWLEDILKNSKGYKKIIFTHYPFIPALRKAMPLQEVEKFNKLVSQYGVRAVFSGHVEVPFYEKISGVEYFVIPGFFRSKNLNMLWQGSFSEISLGLKNRLKLFYKKDGDNEYRTLIIPSKEYEEVKKEQLKNLSFLGEDD